ncbi:MAG TPA: cytochrome c, partial [Candidatus Hydrogenedentes bacterium]|nr:cytochrome c [Candidatus Hydrogenedentota bacterium]
KTAALGLAFSTLAAGCHQGMWNGSRIKPLEQMPAVTPFSNGHLLFVEGTVPYGEARTDEHLYTGKINGEYATSFPFEITAADLERGRDRFNIFCAPCHSQAGDGKGMIVQREMKQAGNFHQARLRESAPGYFFDVMTNGFGVMYSYASRVSVEDRWKIAAYIRVLQLSQNASLDDVPEAEKQQLLAPDAAPAQSSEEGSHAAAH